MILISMISVSMTSHGYDISQGYHIYEIAWWLAKRGWVCVLMGTVLRKKSLSTWLHRCRQ